MNLEWVKESVPCCVCSPYERQEQNYALCSSMLCVVVLQSCILQMCLFSELLHNISIISLYICSKHAFPNTLGIFSLSIKLQCLPYGCQQSHNSSSFWLYFNIAFPQLLQFPLPFLQAADEIYRLPVLLFSFKL